MKLKETLGNIDIYLFDQILKERYLTTEAILDAGCGNGRNLYWFYNNNYNIFGIDKDKKKLEAIKKIYPRLAENFYTASVEAMPFKNETFHHVICNAVLHFAESTIHFEAMCSELVRVLKINGTLFVRMTSNIGIENNIDLVSEGVFKLPDGTTRFLITKNLLKKIMKKHSLSFLEPLKTVNVNNKRCMTTLVLKKLPNN